MHTALFDFILLDHVLIDTLHLFLHISDVLTELFIRQLKCEDAIEKKITFNNGFAQEKFKHMDAYEKFLHSIGIAFEWRVDKDSKKLQYRDLTGSEKYFCFKKLMSRHFYPILMIASKLEIFGKVLLTCLGNSD